MLKIIKILIFISALILCADSLFLISQKRIHLGTILPFIIGIIFIAHLFYYDQIKLFLKHHFYLEPLWKISWILFALWSISLVVFFSYISSHTKTSPQAVAPQAIIVLGSGVIQGKASPTLALRLDRAAEVAKQYPNAFIIVSGGQDFGEKDTEAQIMSHYLQQNFHISQNRIKQENQSTSTELNLQNSQPILFQYHLNLDSPIAIVTSDFHTLRAKAIAKKQGYRNITLWGSSTPLMTRYNAWLREYFAYILGWILNEY